MRHASTVVGCARKVITVLVEKSNARINKGNPCTLTMGRAACWKCPFHSTSCLCWQRPCSTLVLQGIKVRRRRQITPRDKNFERHGAANKGHFWRHMLLYLLRARAAQRPLSTEDALKIDTHFLHSNQYPPDFVLACASYRLNLRRQLPHG
jgi:hypothetical protein